MGVKNKTKLREELERLINEITDDGALKNGVLDERIVAEKIHDRSDVITTLVNSLSVEDLVNVYIERNITDISEDVREIYKANKIEMIRLKSWAIKSSIMFSVIVLFMVIIIMLVEEADHKDVIGNWYRILVKFLGY